MKKLDIMNERDLVAPGDVCKWQIVGGKASKTEDIVPEVKEEIKVIGPVVKEGIKEVEIVKKKLVKKKKEAEKKWVM